MPSHLHPRSRLTTSLFGTTLLVSFLVVGIPHILPCPAPRAEFADGEIMEDGRRRRRRRRPQEETTDGVRKLDNSEKMPLAMMSEEAEEMARRAHECPVPKPKGFIGKMFGFEETESDHDR